MNQAYVALGTNIEPRYDYLIDAIKMLEQSAQITITKKSSIYETAPVGYTDQDYFLNMVVELDTTFDPVQLLDVCQEIELNLGRKRTIRFGPRTIDLDILLYNNENIKTERLNIPHPRLHERAFVLVPFADIAPNRKISPFNKSVADLLHEVSANDQQNVVRWKESKDLE